MQERPPLSRTTKLTIITAFILFSAYNLVLTALQDYILFITADRGALGTSFGVFTLSAVLSRFLAGWILEKVDDAVILVSGNLVLTCALTIYPIASEVMILYVIRAIQGVGWGITTVTVLTMIVENTENSRVSIALGYLNGLGSLSLLMFPVLGSWLVTIKSYETFTMCFLSAGAISVASTGLSVYAWRTIPPILTHEPPISGLPEHAVFTPTLSVFFLFMVLGVVLSYSPEIAEINEIQNPGLFFSFFAFAQILGSGAGGSLTSNGQYRKIAVIGGILVTIGATILVAIIGLVGYLVSAIVIGFGLAIANIALNSYVSSVSKNSQAKGMALYSAGVDMAIAVGSIGTALFLNIGWNLHAVLLIFAGTAAFSSIQSYINIRD